MALFAVLAAALLLSILTFVTHPAAVQADPDQRTSPPPGAQGQSALASGASARPEQATGGAGLPKLGKASNPYDMKALRNFNAGSHQ